MYLEHSRSQQSVYKVSLPSHSDSFLSGLGQDSSGRKGRRRLLY
jgi:hypothetical protein